MANRRRGEVSAELDGKQWTLCLTLGALAELETSFDVSNLSELADKFSSGTLSASDLIKILGAGLRGAGHILSDEDIRNMQVENGALGYAKVATELLSATFETGSA